MEEQPARFHQIMLSLTDVDQKLVWMMIARTTSQEIEDFLVTQRAARENRRPAEHDCEWAASEFTRKVRMLAKYFLVFV
jgi:hypothetical protein